MPPTTDTGTHEQVLGTPVCRPLLLAFAAYGHRYVQRHFHTVRCATTGWRPTPGVSTPTVVYLNHAAWWDPMICLLLWNHWFRHSHSFALIDETALAKYPFFRRLGFVGVPADSTRAAARFLRLGQAIAARPNHMLWITPQARFADPRERPLGFKPGLGHLAAKLARPTRTGTDLASNPVGSLQFVPLAIEYAYWHEPRPEVLIRWGEPIRIQPGDPAAPQTPADWSELLQSRLAETMNSLAASTIARQAHDFEPLLRGSTGVARLYDLWRHAKAMLTGKTFTPRHGQL